jgi:hypothetical protein
MSQRYGHRWQGEGWFGRRRDDRLDRGSHQRGIRKPERDQPEHAEPEQLPAARNTTEPARAKPSCARRPGACSYKTSTQSNNPKRNNQSRKFCASREALNPRPSRPTPPPSVGSCLQVARALSSKRDLVTTRTASGVNAPTPSVLFLGVARRSVDAKAQVEAYPRCLCAGDFQGRG